MNTRNFQFLLFALLLSVSTTLFSQKIYVNYTVFDNNNDSIKLIAKPFSDVEIESDSSDFHLKLLPEKFRKPTRVIDDAGRLFERITIKGKSVLVRTLVKGQNNLYLNYQNKKIEKYVLRSKSNAENAVNYIVTNHKDSFVLSKNDKIENNVFKEDQKYKGQLQYLSRDYPELFNEIKSIKFDNSQIQSLIYKLNSNYANTPNIKLPVTLYKDFLSVGLMGNYGPNLKDYTLSCLMIRYFMNLSTNTSFRVGIMAHLDETFENYSEIRDLNNTILVPAFRLTYYQHYLGVPVLVNIEKTNSFVTPYFYLGFMPMLYRLSNINNINDFKYIGKPSFEFDIRVGAGLKVKINDQLNLKTELKSNLTSDPLNLNFGIDYNFNLFKNNIKK